ncbi:MAG: hypothetical protein SFY69_01310 [Planctomycetota bacterium]|nr:hypothetical protein [Planctomycetota bacterium]
MGNDLRFGGWRKAAGRMVVVAGLAVGAAITLHTESAAQAQPEGRGRGGFGGGGGPGGGMREAWMGPALTARQLERYADLVGLTEDQQVAAEAIVEAYQEQVRQQGETMRQKTEEIRAEWEDTRDPTVWQGMRKVMQDVREERKKLDDGLMEEIKSILEPTQEEKWPAFERAVRRDQGVRRGLMSGERVNLFDLVERVEMAPEARSTVDAALSEYDVELDRALTTRNAAYEEAFTKMMELRQAGNMEEMQALMDKGREASVRVREINRKYARQLMDMLPEEKREEFDAAFKRESFPEVYRPTMAQRALDAAAGFEDLTDTQRESVRTLRESYSRTLRTSNDKMASAIEENEMKATVGAMMMQRFGGGREQGPLDEIRRERRESNSATLESLRKILSPEQIERLPSREQGEDEERGGGRRRGRPAGDNRT